MDKTITFKVEKKDYIKLNLSMIFNVKRIFSIFFICICIAISQVINDFSVAYFIANVIVTFAFFVFFYIFFLVVYIFNSISIFNREKCYSSDVTINFSENELEEITICSTYKLKYEDILKMKLLRSVLFIYISPVRIIIIPKRDSYDIKEIYSELNKLRKIKNTKVLASN